MFEVTIGSVHSNCLLTLLKEENKRKIYIITQKGKERLELEKEKMQKQIILFMKKDYEDEI